MLKKILSLMALALVQFGFAQTGTISGKLIDGEFNDVLPFANILIKGTTQGATSDFDGRYALDVAPGTYTLVFSFLGYTPKEVAEVVVAAGKTLEINVSLQPASSQLEEVVLTTTVRKNTEASVLNLQKNSVTLMDGLSLEAIKTAGAGDIADAIKRVPGVSVQEGKYVYVRGLGDRYTKSILN